MLSVRITDFGCHVWKFSRPNHNLDEFANGGDSKSGEGNWWERKKGKQKESGKKWKESSTAPASLQPCSEGSLLPDLDQDSLEREARISIWGIGRNV